LSEDPDRRRLAVSRFRSQGGPELLFELEKQRTKVEIGPRIDVTPNLQLGVIYETGITPEGLDVNSALFTARLAF
jgi:hypothetical protein